MGPLTSYGTAGLFKQSFLYKVMWSFLVRWSFILAVAAVFYTHSRVLGGGAFWVLYSAVSIHWSYFSAPRQALTPGWWLVVCSRYYYHYNKVAGRQASGVACREPGGVIIAVCKQGLLSWAVCKQRLLPRGIGRPHILIQAPLKAL